MIWKSSGDDVFRKYDFGYDAVNRFMKGAFEQKDGATWGNSVMDYTVRMGNGIDPATAYDFNGNIKSMSQFGWKPGGSQRIDSLSYTYNSLLTNKLKAVSDSNNDSLTKLRDFWYNPSTKTSTDYYYDLNGNLIQDKNKQITTIGYNYLNLVQYVGLNRNGESQYVYYTYDATGNKVEKWAGEVEQELSTFTNYIGANVYERKSGSGSTEPLRLLFINDDEGRIRFIPQFTDNNITGGTMAYDYFIKDHLGNVRMVLTDELKADAYPNLSFENDDPSTQSINELDLQNQYWDNSNGYSIDVVNVRYARPSAMGDTTANGSYVRRLRRSTGAIGATKLLKVMAGDRIHTKIEYYYGTTNSATNNAGANPLNSFVTSLISSFTYSDQVGGLIKNDVQTFTNQLSNNSSFLSAINPTPNSSGSNEAPRAYLNVLFFDEQFKFDSASSRIIKVAYGPGAKRTIDQTFSNAIIAGKSGYVYIYFSNESETFVYIDNFQLAHERGSLLEETHYYPFGLIMEGISSRAANTLQNKFLYNSKELQTKEFSDGSGLEMTDFGARLYDNQLGLWHTIDPLADISRRWSPYSYCYNNPIRFVDPDGMKVEKGSQEDWDDNKKAVNGMLEKVNADIDKIIQIAKDKNWSESKLNRKLGNLNERATSIKSSLDRISALEKSDVEYRLAVKSENSSEGRTFAQNGGVTIEYDGTARVFVHETTHAYQFETGDVIHFNNNDPNGTITDLGDEVEAWKAMYLFDPTHKQFAEISGTQDITPEALKTMKAYSSFPSANINLNSTIGDLVKAGVVDKSNAPKTESALNAKVKDLSYIFLPPKFRK